MPAELMNGKSHNHPDYLNLKSIIFLLTFTNISGVNA